MSRVRGLESVKAAIKIKEKPYDVYYFTRQDGSVLELREVDIEEISKFGKFRKTYGFLAWLKYQIKLKTGGT